MKKSSISIGSRVNAGGTKFGQLFLPASLNTRCPHCATIATFSLSRTTQGEAKFVLTAKSTCPSCRKRVLFSLHFWPNAHDHELVDISMFPSPSYEITEIEVPNDMPDLLKRAIRDAEECYRAGLYSPTVASAGKALEGLLKQFSDQKEQRLVKLIDSFCKSDEVAKPIRTLAHTMRESRNKAAHFDETIVPDEEAAKIMLELLRYLVAYLFLFSERAEKLGTKLTGEN